MNLLDKCLFFDKNKYTVESINLYHILISTHYFRWIRTGKTGLDILNKLDGKKTINEIINEISSEYDIPSDIVEDHVTEFCSQAEKQELIYHSKTAIKDPVVDKDIRHLSYHITNYCNRKCVYCNMNNVENKEEASFISIDEFNDNMALLFPSGKCPNASIYLTGGEPLAHPNIMAIIDILKRYEAQIILWTNGDLLTEELASELSNRGVVLFISLDSMDKNINDSARGERAFDNVLKASRLCNEYNIEFLYSLVISKYNLDNLDDIISLTQEQNAKGVFFNMQINYSTDNNSLLEYFDFTYDEYWEKMLSFSKKVHIINSWRNKNSASKAVLRMIREDSLCLNSINFIQPKRTCGAGINKISIDHNGYIYPCKALHQIKFKLGNIREYALSREREFLPSYLYSYEKCQSCQAQLFCLGGCKAEIMTITGNIDIRSKKYCNIKRDAIKKQLWAPVMLSKIDTLVGENE